MTTQNIKFSEEYKNIKTSFLYQYGNDKVYGEFDRDGEKVCEITVNSLGFIIDENSDCN